MKESAEKNKSVVQKSRSKKILKIIGFSFLGLLSLLLLAAVGVSIYFNNNKKEIVAKINVQINENIKGTVSIGDVGYKFLTGFPDFTVKLSEVELKDSLWASHKRTLLTAKEIEVHLNIVKLVLDNTVDIEKIQINNAKIDIYKDKNGLSNSNIFRPKPKTDTAKKGKKTIIEKIALEQVHLISENVQRDKLFDFNVTSLESEIVHTDSGWKTNLYVNTFAKSMAFNVKKGSFIKDKKIEGTLALEFSSKENKINVVTKNLNIGEDEFDITGHFNLDKKNQLFDLDINTEILWGNASRLLSANILRTLKKFDIQKPINVNCTIAGNMGLMGDPKINVKAIIKDNVVKFPDGEITNCSFNAEYINEYKKGEGFSDENSAVIATNLTGSYLDIPISVPKGILLNFTTPKASGIFKSKFKASQLTPFINEDVLTISEGDASVYLKFNVDIVNLKFNKPTFSGNVLIKEATLNYKPKEIAFTKTDVQLNFTENALIIDKIKYTNKNNTILMKGKIDNFLNLYYNDPENMVVKWSVYSPSFDAQQLITVLAKNKKTTVIKKTPKKMVSDKIQTMIDHCKVIIDIKADKMVYKNLTASSVNTTIQLNNGQLFIQNGVIKTCNGNVTFKAQLVPKNNLYHFSANASINTVDIPQFLTAFNNFGITSFQPKDINGNLTIITSVKGIMNQTGGLVENSLNCNVNYKVIHGSLDNFEPIIKVGKTALPNRDVTHIKFEDLEGKLNINGELVTVDFFKVSSSVLNFDVKGVYSFGKGTDLQMTIPLRNPKDDYKITDKAEREQLRYKGVVAHLQAVDGPDGKIKINLNPQNQKTSSPFKKSDSNQK